MLSSLAEKEGKLILIGERLGECSVTQKSSTELTQCAQPGRTSGW